MGDNSVLVTAPPDDTGSDSFARFKYQAKLAFPFFLRCGLGGEEVSLVPEHIEDLTIEYPDRWCFIQIKSRNASQGMWTLSDLLGEDGALHSLYRAHQACPHLAARYELLLEQPLSPHGPAMNLRSPEKIISKDVVEPVRKALGISKKACVSFLTRVSVRPQPPGRSDVDAVNLRLLGSQASALRFEDVMALYKASLSRIEQAMVGEPPGVRWPDYMGRASLSDAIVAKRLTREACAAVLGGLSASVGPLLRRVLDPALPAPTTLQAKLLAAQASEQTVEDAVYLRAQASYAELSHLAGGVSQARERLEDLQTRLRIRARAVVESQQAHPAGPAAWNAVQDVLHTHAEQLDPHGVFMQDPMLLLGAVCDLSDRCLVDWKPRA